MKLTWERYGSMKSLKSFLILAALFCGGSLFAQHSVSGVWLQLGVDRELTDRLDLKGGLQVRTLGSFIRYQTSFFDLGLDYKIAEGVDAEVNYRLGYRQDVAGNFDLRQRFNFDLSYEYDFGKPELSMRLRYQAARRGVAAFEERIPELREAFRYRIKGSTEIVDDFDVDLSYEWFMSRDERGFDWSDWRLRVEFKRKINKRQDLTFGYLLQRQVLTADPRTEHVITLGYSFEL